MVFKTLRGMRNVLIERLHENELRERLLELKRSKLMSIMIWTTGKRRHHETKEQMTSFILGNTSESAIKRILNRATL